MEWIYGQKTTFFMNDYLYKNQNAYSKIAPFYKSAEDWYEKDGHSIDEFLTNLKPEAKILSIGSGTGHLEGYTQQKGFIVTGIDLAIGMVEIANAKFPNCKFLVMNGEDLKFMDNTFDAVISRYASQHMTFDKLIKGIARVTVTNGQIWLMAHTANADEPETIEFGWNEINDKAIMILPTQTSVIDKIKQANLQIKEIKSYPERSKLMDDVLFRLIKS